MKELPHTHSCFVCGESNPIGLKLRFHTDGQVVRTEFTPRPEHIGFQQTVHGGIISTLLDEIMVWACAVRTAQFAFCAELNVRFVSPARPGRPLVATGELVANRRARIFEAKADLREGNSTLLATATGKYLPLKADGLVEMARDLVGDMSAILRTDPEPT